MRRKADDFESRLQELALIRIFAVPLALALLPASIRLKPIIIDIMIHTHAPYIMSVVALSAASAAAAAATSVAAPSPPPPPAAGPLLCRPLPAVHVVNILIF